VAAEYEKGFAGLSFLDCHWGECLLSELQKWQVSNLKGWLLMIKILQQCTEEQMADGSNP